MSSVWFRKPSTMARMPDTPIIDTGTPRRFPNSRVRSAAGPLASPVFTSTRPCTGLLARKAARRVPVGAKGKSAARQSITIPNAANNVLPAGM